MRELHTIFVRVLLFSLSINTAYAGQSSEAAIASAHPLATEAGISILKQGGNAFDAAVTVSAVLAVVEPYSSGIGGGGFWLLHSAGTKKDTMIDGRERAPLAATRDMFLDKSGDVIPKASIDGPLSAGIPGMPAALAHLATNYGALPLSVTLKPAIDIAKNGFEVDNYFRKMMGFRLEAIQSSWAAAEIFLDDDQTPRLGYKLIQTDLAKTLEAIANHGSDGFYKGEVANKLVSSVKSAGGIWSHEDLSSYRVVEREPVTGEFNGMKITSASPPSSGGVALVEMFNMLSNLDYMNSSGSQRVHHVVEVVRRAYRDRAEYLGDTDFVDVPVNELTSKNHAKKIIKTFTTEKATPSVSLKRINSPAQKSVDTTHFSIIDKNGNRVAATLSINYPFGSGFVAEGTGVLLNDEMDDFSVKPNAPNIYGLVGGEANAIEPGKRMLSSMSPTFLETKDRVAAIGTPGGSRIITMVMLAALAFYEDGDVETLVNLPRYHHQYLPDKIFFESDALTQKIVNELVLLGHDLEEKTSPYGNMQVVIRNKKTSIVSAASDKRGIGKSVVLH